MGHLNRQGHHEQIRSISKWIAVLKSRPICPQNRIHHQENPRRIANRLSLDAQVLQVRNRRLYRRRPVLLIKARTPRLRIVVFIRRPTFLHNGRLLYGNKAVEKEHRSLLIGRNAPRQRQVRRPGAFQGNRKEPPPQDSDGSRKSPETESSKDSTKRRGGIARIPRISGQPWFGQDQKRSRSGDVLDKPAKVSKTDESPQSISLSASDVEPSPHARTSARHPDWGRTFCGVDTGPAGHCSVQGQDRESKSKKGQDSPATGEWQSGKKLAPAWANEGPAKLKSERKSDIRPRKKPTPPDVKATKGESTTRDIIDMPSGEMVATEPSRRSPLQVEKAG